MSLDTMRTYDVPDQTALVARAIFPHTNPVMRFYAGLHMVVEDLAQRVLAETRQLLGLHVRHEPIRVRVSQYEMDLVGVALLRCRCDWSNTNKMEGLLAGLQEIYVPLLQRPSVYLLMPLLSWTPSGRVPVAALPDRTSTIWRLPRIKTLG